MTQPMGLSLINDFQFFTNKDVKKFKESKIMGTECDLDP